MNEATKTISAYSQVAGVYVRLSDEDEEKESPENESESIQNQKSMLLRHCMEMGWDVYDIYCDEDYSGAGVHRPDFERLMKDCENGKINIVVCKTQSRFSRDMEVIEHYLHNKFLEWGVRFISIVDNADTSVKGNKKARQINGLVNEWFLEDLSENIRSTLNDKKRRGEWCGSFATYGYMRDPNNKNRMIVDSEAAEVVREIFEMYLSGMGATLIAKELNSRGVPSPARYKRSKGSKCNGAMMHKEKTSDVWSPLAIYRILRREEYVGVLVQNRRETISYKNKKKRINPREMWIRVPNTHEAIISVETWEKTQSTFKARGRPVKDTGKRHIFSQKVYCGECAGVLSKNTGKNAEYLRCRTHHSAPETCGNIHAIRMDTLEKKVLEEINKLLAAYHNPEKIVIKDKAQETRLEVLQKEKVKLSAMIEKKNKAIETLYFDKIEGLITYEQFMQFNKSVQGEIKELAIKLENVCDKLNSYQEIPQADTSAILEKYLKVDKLTHEAVNEFIDVIYVNKLVDEQREVKIVFNF